MVIRMIEESFRPAVRNWPVVVVDVVLLLLYIFLFILMVGLPLMVLLGGAFGFDPSEIRQLPRVLDDFGRFVGQNVLGAFTVVSAFLLYLLIVSTVALFAFGATLGVITRSVTDPDYRFSLSLFVSEGRRLFWRIMWLSLFLGLFFIMAFAGLGLVGALWVMATGLVFSMKTGLGYFLGTFFTLLGLTLAFVVFLLAWAVSTWAMVILLVKDTRSMDAFTEAVSFMRKNPRSILFFLGLSAIYVGAVIGVSMLTIPFQVLPAVGLILGIPAQILSYLCNRFFGIILFAALVRYFLEVTKPEPGIQSPPVVPEEPSHTLPSPGEPGPGEHPSSL